MQKRWRELLLKGSGQLQLHEWPKGAANFILNLPYFFFFSHFLISLPTLVLVRVCLRDIKRDSYLLLSNFLQTKKIKKVIQKWMVVKTGRRESEIGLHCVSHFLAYFLFWGFKQVSNYKEKQMYIPKPFEFSFSFSFSSENLNLRADQKPQKRKACKYFLCSFFKGKRKANDFAPKLVVSCLPPPLLMILVHKYVCALITTRLDSINKSHS